MRTTASTTTEGVRNRRRVRVKHLGDRVFAGLGYAVAIAATTLALLTAHLGRLATVTGIGLIVLLATVNLSLIRRAARPGRRTGAASGHPRDTSRCGPRRPRRTGPRA